MSERSERDEVIHMLAQCLHLLTRVATAEMPAEMPAEAPAEVPAEAPTRSQVAEALLAVARQNRDRAVDILRRYDAATLSDVEASDYAALYRDLKTDAAEPPVPPAPPSAEKPPW